MKTDSKKEDTKKSKLGTILEITLWTIMLIVVIQAQIDGKYIRNTNTIIEVCNGQDALGRQLQPPMPDYEYYGLPELNITTQNITGKTK